MHTLKKNRQSRLGSFIKKACQAKKIDIHTLKKKQTRQTRIFIKILVRLKKIDIRTLKLSRQSRLGSLLKF